MQARGDLAQHIVDGMKSLDPAPEEAAVCVLHGRFTLDDDSHQRELATVEMSNDSDKDEYDLHTRHALARHLLTNTSYDCFFLGGPSKLILNVDNLPINVSITSIVLSPFIVRTLTSPSGCYSGRPLQLRE